MNRDEMFVVLADERVAFADLLEGLTPAQLASPSLCAGWTVKHVAAHVTTLFNVTMPQMAVRIGRNKFNFDKAVRQLTNELAQRPIEHIVTDLRSHATSRKHPPTAVMAPLTDLIVHGEDVRRPLGLAHQVPHDAISLAMGFVTSGSAKGFVPGSRIRGLRFQATDDERAWGKGQLIHGPAISLLMGVMGRRPALKELGGAVQVLDDRLTGKVPRIQ